MIFELQKRLQKEKLRRLEAERVASRLILRSQQMHRKNELSNKIHVSHKVDHTDEVTRKQTLKHRKDLSLFVEKATKEVEIKSKLSIETIDEEQSVYASDSEIDMTYVPKLEEHEVPIYIQVYYFDLICNILQE